MRLQSVNPPDAMHHRRTDIEYIGQRSNAPMCSVGWNRLRRSFHDKASDLVASGWLASPRGSSFAMPAKPLSANRLRQQATIRRSVLTSVAMSLFFMPAAAFKAILTRVTNRAGVLRPRDQRSNTLRSFSMSVSRQTTHIGTSPFRESSAFQRSQTNALINKQQ